MKRNFAGDHTGFDMSFDTSMWAVVLAGGDGTRLQELTLKVHGDARPKQFSSIMGATSLLGHTRVRLRRIFHDDRVMFVVKRDHKEFYDDELSDVDTSRIIAQPSNRGTGVAIMAAILRLLQLNTAAIVGFFPSDHYFADDAAFAATVQSAIEISKTHRDSIVLIGAKPQWPEVEYGWIEPGAQVTSDSHTPFFTVSRFWEKPQHATAQYLMRTGALWNTFVTVGRTLSFLKLFTDTLRQAMTQVSDALARGNMDVAYRQIETIDFSKDVLSRDQRKLLVIPDKNSGWADLGNPLRVMETLIRNRIEPSWFRKIRDFPPLLEELPRLDHQVERPSD